MYFTVHRQKDSLFVQEHYVCTQMFSVHRQNTPFICIGTFYMCVFKGAYNCVLQCKYLKVKTTTQCFKSDILFYILIHTDKSFSGMKFV